MSPQSLMIDHSRLLDRVNALNSCAPALERCASDQHDVNSKVVEQQPSERAAQIKGLVAGTLLFMPFLIGYLVAVRGQ